MVSEAIYKFFQALYDEETKRFAELESRARLYFSIASLYVGAIAFKFDDVVKLVGKVNLPIVSSCSMVHSLSSAYSSAY